MDAGEQFARELAHVFPEFQDQLDGYLEDGDGFAYVFLAVEVTPELVAAHNTDRAGGAVELDWRSLLAFLDKWFRRADPVVENVIKASFLLQLPYPNQPGGAEIVEDLPEGLAQGLRAVRAAG